MGFFIFTVFASSFLYHIFTRTPLICNAIRKLAGNVLIPAGVIGLAGCFFAVLLLICFFFPCLVDKIPSYKKNTGNLLFSSVIAIREQCETLLDSDEWDRKRIIAGGIYAFFALGFFCAATLSLVCASGPAYGNVYIPLIARFMIAAAICLGGAGLLSLWLYIDFRQRWETCMSITRLIHNALEEDINDQEQMSFFFKLLCTFLDYEISSAALDSIYTIVWRKPDSDGGRMCIAIILNDFGPNPDTASLTEAAVNALRLLKDKYERYLPKGENV